MTPQELAQFSREKLGTHANRSGGIFYSKPETLKNADVYLMGYNPGGDSGPSINAELDKNFARDKGFYDETWQHRSGKHGDGTIRHKDVKGLTRYQRGIDEFISLLGYDLAQVFVTNLIFFQSHGDYGVNYSKDSDICWPIHEKMLNVVKPKVIVAVGNGNSGSAYTKLYQNKRAFMDKQSVVSEKANHGQYRLKGFRFTENGQQVAVLGLPHFSYYNVKPNEALLMRFINKLIL